MHKLPAPIVHPQTLTELTRWSTRPAQSTLVVGPNGVGKKHIAKHMGALLTQDQQLDISSDQWTIDSSAKASFSIEGVRTALAQFKHKAGTEIRRLLYIFDLDELSIEAQNALLKFLEEPPQNLYIIMTARSVRNLPATIASRCAVVVARPLGLEETKKLLAGESSERAAQLWTRWQGRAGEIFTEATLGQTSNPGLELAKQFLSGTSNQRLSLVETLKNKAEAQNFVSELVLLLGFLVHKDSGSRRAEQILRLYAAAVQAEQDLVDDVSLKLSLLRLCVSTS